MYVFMLTPPHPALEGMVLLQRGLKEDKLVCIFHIFIFVPEWGISIDLSILFPFFLVRTGGHQP